MEEGLIGLEQRGALGFVRLKRPVKLNALNRAMYAELNRAIAQINSDPTIRVGIICAEGRAFSAGVDTRDVTAAIAELNGGPADSVAAQFSLDFEETECNPKPLIAAINGLCVGNGLTMALACDLRIAASDAQFSLPEVKVGIASVHGTLRAVQMAGLGKALELLLTGEMRDANWAHAAGLINEIVAPDQLEPRAQALAELIAAMPPGAIQATRMIANRAALGSFDEVVQLGTSLRGKTAFRDTTR